LGKGRKNIAVVLFAAFIYIPLDLAANPSDNFYLSRGQTGTRKKSANVEQPVFGIFPVQKAYPQKKFADLPVHALKL